MLVAALLENLWLLLRWVDATCPITFTTFCEWIRHELEEELERRWYVEANGVGVPEMYGPVPAGSFPSDSTL